MLDQSLQAAAARRVAALCLALACWAGVVFQQGCGGGAGVDHGPWERVTGYVGIGTHYSPLVVEGKAVRVYPTALGAEFGKVWVRQGGLQTVGDAQVAIEVPGLYIRTAGVARHAGRWYALVHVGNGYPTSIGYRPAWAESDDGIAWNYMGYVNVDGAPQSCFSSSNALVRLGDEWIGFEDCYGKKLAVIRSKDGLNWCVDGEAWQGTENPVFPSAAVLNGVIHLIAQAGWPGGKMRHLTSADGGRTWWIVEAEVPLHSEKGANLAASDDTLYALINGWLYAMKPK